MKRRMKTLDEVIAYFDNQTQQRHVYLTEDAEDIYNDALHYLKEYKQDHMTMVEAAKSLTAKEHELAQNDPLTWTELQGMVGKPVWIEAGNGSRWIVIDSIRKRVFADGEYLKATNNGEFYDKDFGELWQAYRKERS